MGCAIVAADEDVQNLEIGCQVFETEQYSLFWLKWRILSYQNPTVESKNR